MSKLGCARCKENNGWILNKDIMTEINDYILFDGDYNSENLQKGITFICNTLNCNNKITLNFSLNDVELVSRRKEK